MTSLPFQEPDPHPRASQRVVVPKGACDSHAHVIGPHARYPLVNGREGVTAPEALLVDYLAMLDALGLERGVLVQPGVYGTDNTSLTDAIATAPRRLRGIAVVENDITEKELLRLRERGVRGVRFNTRGGSAMSAGRGKLASIDTVKAFGAMLAACGMHVQMLIPVDKFADLDKSLADFPVDIVIDHMGYFEPSAGLNGDGFQALLRCLGSGRFWVKLSAPYRFSTQDVPYPEVSPFAQKMVQAAPDRVLWATDWPHSAVFRADGTEKRRMPNAGELLDRLADWAPDTATQQKILVDNPVRLYGFD